MRSILIIDDEHGIAEALSALLTDQGYRTFSAANGQQGLGKLDEAQPTAIVVDFMMPILDGAGVLRALRANPTWKHVPVILMSAVPESTVRLRCGNTYQAFLQKPFNAEELLEALSRLVDGNDGHHAATDVKRGA